MADSKQEIRSSITELRGQKFHALNAHPLFRELLLQDALLMISITSYNINALLAKKIIK
jgi:hypothetical protein